MISYVGITVQYHIISIQDTIQNITSYSNKHFILIIQQTYQPRLQLLLFMQEISLHKGICKYQVPKFMVRIYTVLWYSQTLQLKIVQNIQLIYSLR